MDRFRTGWASSFVVPKIRSRNLILRVAGLTALAAALVGTVAAVTIQARQPTVLDVGDVEIVVEPPIRTGHQRAERAVFAPDGQHLVVTCPRYNRVVVYRVGASESAVEVADFRVEGQPVAVEATEDRLYVLQRPRGDARHLEPAWWRAYDFQGQAVGSKFRVGWDPDDMVLADDGRTMLVILSGHAEGETNRPDPSMIVVDLADPVHPRIRGELTFDQPGDNPERIAFRPSPTRPDLAAVSLRGSRHVAWLDLTDRDRPRLLDRGPLPSGGEPGTLAFGDAGTLLVADQTSGEVWSLDPPHLGQEETDVNESTHTQARRVPLGPGIGEFAHLPDRAGIDGPPGWLVGTLPDDSRLAFLDPRDGSRVLVPLSGTLGFGTVLPQGLAATVVEGRVIVAVADRTGGVHLVRVRTGGQVAVR